MISKFIDDLCRDNMGQMSLTLPNDLDTVNIQAIGDGKVEISAGKYKVNATAVCAKLIIRNYTAGMDSIETHPMRLKLINLATSFAKLPGAQDFAASIMSQIKDLVIPSSSLLEQVVLAIQDEAADNSLLHFSKIDGVVTLTEISAAASHSEEGAGVGGAVAASGEGHGEGVGASDDTASDSEDEDSALGIRGFTEMLTEEAFANYVLAQAGLVNNEADNAPAADDHHAETNTYVNTATMLPVDAELAGHMAGDIDVL